MSAEVDPSILCAACGTAAPADVRRCPACGADVLLDGRYRLDRVVGRGSAGITYRATVVATGAVVAIKELPLRDASPSVRDRVRREARVLRELDHPCIPAYVDDFVAGAGRHRALYLAQTFIDGPTLREEAAARRYRPAEVLEVLDEVAAILEYLHGLSPPVIHRDLKPGNLVRRAADRRLVLIDFGAVRDVLQDPRTGGSTVVGTYGYMAPEQFRGEATPATDLYALGALAVVLLSRRDPLELVGPDHLLRWQQALSAPAGIRALIAALLEPDPARRPASATEVRRRIARLREAPEEAPGGEVVEAALSPALRDLVSRSLAAGEHLRWAAQPPGARLARRTLPMFLFGIPWTAFALFWMGLATLFTDEGEGPFALFPLFGLPFVLVGLGLLSAPLRALLRARRTAYVVTDRRAFVLTGGRRTALRPFTATELLFITRTEHADGTGDLVVGGGETKSGRLADGFYGVRDARAVEQMMNEIAGSPARSRVSAP